MCSSCRQQAPLHEGVLVYGDACCMLMAVVLPLITDVQMHQTNALALIIVGTMARCSCAQEHQTLGFGHGDFAVMVGRRSWMSGKQNVAFASVEILRMAQHVHTMNATMDIRDVAKDTPNNVKIVQRAVDEQARCLCLPEQARAIVEALVRNSTAGQLTECVKEQITTALTRGYNANDMRMIAAYALAAAAWLDMDAADRGEGSETL